MAAKECVDENALLRRLMPDCIEDTGGLFVTTPEDDPDYADRFLAGCHATSLPVEELEVAEALRREPRLNPGDPAGVRGAGRLDRRVEDRLVTRRAAPPPTARACSRITASSTCTATAGR